MNGIILVARSIVTIIIAIYSFSPANKGKITTPAYNNWSKQQEIIILYPDERRPTTVRSNDTLVDTPFQLISGFFHVSLVF